MAIVASGSTRKQLNARAPEGAVPTCTDFGLGVFPCNPYQAREQHISDLAEGNWMGHTLKCYSVPYST